MQPLSLLRSILFASIAFSTLDTLAGLPGYKTRTIESKNGQYVLVLLTPQAERTQLIDFIEYIDDVYDYYKDDEKRELIEDFEKELAIEEQYSVSGLYANDGSTEPIWKVSYISLCQEVHVANDGIHLVVMYSPWDSSCSGTRQLSFYSSGSKVFSYGSDFEFVPLISMRLLMRACLGIECPIDESSYIDDRSTEFIVNTNQRDKLVFDLATGARLKRSSPWPFYFGIPVAAVPLGVWMWHKRRPHLRNYRQRTQRRGLNYSLSELLGLVVYLSFALVAVKLYGWFGGVCVVIGTAGAATAGFRSRYAVGWFLGAILALYGAYVAALFLAIFDDLLLNKFDVTPLWWDGGWWLCIPLGIIPTFAIYGALFARRMCSEKSSY